MGWILAIDPGNKLSAYVLLDPDLRPIQHDKIENEALFNVFQSIDSAAYMENIDLDVAIEMVESYGMPVGREVFDTCVWIGIYSLFFEILGRNVTRIYRHEEKLTICHSPRANDATIRTAMIDRFAPGVPNKGKGYKKAPGWFYGFRADVWQAYAVGVTFHDLKKSNVLKE